MMGGVEWSLMKRSMRDTRVEGRRRMISAAKPLGLPEVLKPLPPLDAGILWGYFRGRGGGGSPASKCRRA